VGRLGRKVREIQQAPGTNCRRKSMFAAHPLPVRCDAALETVQLLHLFLYGAKRLGCAASACPSNLSSKPKPCALGRPCARFDPHKATFWKDP
jgi:hypothetical protein